MATRPKSGELIEATVEEVAAWLFAMEGRAVSIHEVRRLDAQALHKLRQEFTRRGLFPADLLPER